MKIENLACYKPLGIKIMMGVMIIIAVFIISTASVSAFSFDNVIKIKDKPLDKIGLIDSGAMPYPAIEIKNAFGLGSTLMEAVLEKHTANCGVECSSEFEITINQDSQLIDDVKFRKLQEDKTTWIDSSIRNYQFYIREKHIPREVKEYKWICEETELILNNRTNKKICSNEVIGNNIEYDDSWIVYNYEVMPAGTYYIKLIGEKKSEFTYDWIITSQGKEINEWSTWGGSSNVTYGSAATWTGQSSQNIARGIRILALSNSNLVSVQVRMDLSGPNQVIVWNSSYYPMVTAPISINTASMNLNLINGETYWITVNRSDGGIFSWYAALTQILPQNYTLFNITAGASGFDPQLTEYYNIQNLTFNLDSSITLNSPINNTISNVLSSTFNCSSSIQGGATLTNISLWDNSTGIWKVNNTQTKTGRTNNSIFTNTYLNNQKIKWSCQACDSDNTCGFASENRTLSFETTSPIINIIYPTGKIDYGKIGLNISLNYSISDLNLQACWYNYGGVNITIPCITNSSLILTTQKNLIMYANDTPGSLSSNTIYWNYSIFENSQTFNSNAYAGANEQFIINLTYDSNYYDGISANLIYNGTSYIGTKSGTGENVLYTKNLIIPAITSQTNKSFYWQIILTNSSNYNTYINSSWSIQTILPLSLDNCAAYTYNLVNFSLFDEDTRSVLNGTINGIVQIYSKGTSDLIGIYNFTSSGVSNSKVCILNLSSSSYDMNYQVLYSNETHATEYKYFQRININSSSIPIDVNLYDLLTANSQAVTLSIRGIDSLRLKGAVVDLQRQYISINQFISVESPLTDISGNAIVHVVLKDAIYNILIYQNGVLLGTFDNYKFECANPLSDCTFLLPLIQAVTPINNYYNYKNLNYYFDLNRNTRVLRMLFYTSDNNVHQISLNTITNDGYGNTTICSNSIATSSGTFTCDIPSSYGNLSIISYPSIDGEYRGGTFMSLDSRPAEIFGGTRILLAMLMYSTITLLFVSNPIGIVVGAILGIIFAIGLSLLDGGTWFGAGSILIWFVIAASIIIWRANRSNV